MYPNQIRDIRNQIFYLSQDVDLPMETGQGLIGRLDRLNLLPLFHTLHRLIDLFSLSPSLLDKQISVLSGGERQRLGLLIGCLTDRPVWLLDEPTSALDNTMKQAVADHIMDSDKTVLAISHDRVWQASDRIRIID